MIQMQAQQNVGGIAGLAVLTPTVHGDDRGYFMETYNQRDMESLGFHYDFVQDNQSGSTYGVLRGLHRQLRYPQTKLVRVVSGTVFDVAVDLRPGSDTYLRWHGEVLSAENKSSFDPSPGLPTVFGAVPASGILLQGNGLFSPGR